MGITQCLRCGGECVVVRVLGQYRVRCLAPDCEAARLHRRALQAASAQRLAKGPLKTSPERPTGEAVRARFEEGGDKFDEAIEEAVELLDEGLSAGVVREAVGFGSLGREIVAAAKQRIAQRKLSSPNGLPTERAA